MRSSPCKRGRNLVATGAKPLAVTDNLNFGNPEKPEIMGQFVLAIRGIGEACLALDMPIVSGNVSLYNETDGNAILPTPTVAVVGQLEDPSHRLGLGFVREGDVIVRRVDERAGGERAGAISMYSHIINLIEIVGKHSPE